MEWTPTRLIHSGQSIGPATAEAVTWLMAENKHPEHGYRACIGLLSLAKRYGKVRLEAACMLPTALPPSSPAGVFSVVFETDDVEIDFFFIQDLNVWWLRLSSAATTVMVRVPRENALTSACSMNASVYFAVIPASVDRCQFRGDNHRLPPWSTYLLKLQPNRLNYSTSSLTQGEVHEAGGAARKRPAR